MKLGAVGWPRLRRDTWRVLAVTGRGMEAACREGQRQDWTKSTPGSLRAFFPVLPVPPAQVHPDFKALEDSLSPL